ncbi:peptidoglycan DD-metalloendopeptidase family protein, partial [Oligoflexia bacterium]|nr:peptidoglycan DD-metalloendopeptidase family protein [Oligoflexia bacterium]
NHQLNAHIKVALAFQFMACLAGVLLLSSTEHPATPLAPDTKIEQPALKVSIDTQKKPKIIEVRSYTVKAGDTLTKIWTKNGGSYKGGLLAAKAFKQVGVSLNTIRPGDTIELKVSAHGIAEYAKGLSGARNLMLKGDEKMGYEAKLSELELVESKRKVSGVILNSFSEAAKRATLPPELIDDFVDLFSARVEFTRSIQAGDVFTAIFTEKKTKQGKTVGMGRIEAASLENGGEVLAAVRYVSSNGEGRYYNEDGQALENYFLRYPLRFTRISSQFSDSRFHPVLKTRRPHKGVDFAAPIGTSVRSVANGVVQKSGWQGASGKIVEIKHSSKWSTAYLHLNTIHSSIRPGARVKRGQIIGTVGKTGLATGPHLHFSLYNYGRYVNPMKTGLPRLLIDKEPIPRTFLRAMLRKIEQEHQTLHLAFADTMRMGI